MTFRQRLSELELRVLTDETTATEQKAERYATERDLCDGMSGLRDALGRLESQAVGTTNALGEALIGFVQEVSLLSAKVAAADPWVKSDPWKGDSCPKGPPGNGQPGGIKEFCLLLVRSVLIRYLRQCCWQTSWDSTFPETKVTR